MAKRVKIKIGDVFCQEHGDGYKSYFQYIADDSEQDGCPVIRIFKTRYAVSENPEIEEIISAKVGLYVHTDVVSGSKFEAGWYKVGESADLGLDGLASARFVELGTKSEDEEEWSIEKISRLDPYEECFVWRCGEPRVNIGPVNPGDWIAGDAFDGSVYLWFKTVELIKAGYIRQRIRMTLIDNVVKRRVWSWIDSYTSLIEPLTMYQYYFHFHGENLVREVIEKPDGDIVCLSSDKPTADGISIYYGKFGDIGWDSHEFIGKEKFEEVWDKCDPGPIATVEKNGFLRGLRDRLCGGR